MSGMALPAKIPASVSAMSFDLMGLLHPTPPAGVPRVSGISDKTRYGHLKFSTSKRVSLEHDGENTMENKAGRRLQVMPTLANRRVVLAKTLADW